MLNPKLYINQSFDEISKLIIENKDAFFNLISEQFKVATNINQSNGKDITKTLKFKKNICVKKRNICYNILLDKGG